MTSTFKCQVYEATSDHVELYVVHLHNSKLRSNTIRSHLSSIAFHLQSTKRQSPTESFGISKLLASYAKSDPPPNTRHPITEDILKDIISSLKRMPYTPHDRTMLISLFTLMYHALLRICEVTHSTKNPHNLRPDQIRVRTNNTSRLSVKFETFKFSKPGVKRLDILPSTRKTCSVTAYERYTEIRFRNSKVAFCLSDGSSLSTTYVTNQLRGVLRHVGLPPQDFNNHSFRIGKATDMAKLGFTDTQICMAGRWSSSAFKQYIKPQLLQLNH